MANIQIQDFSGIAPRQDNRLLAPNMAQQAQNTRLKNGTLDNYRFSTDEGDLAADSETIYLWRYIDENGDRQEVWVEYNYHASIAASVIADDEYARFFHTGNPDGKIWVQLYDKDDTSTVTYPLHLNSPTDPTVEQSEATIVDTIRDNWVVKGHYGFDRNTIGSAGLDAPGTFDTYATRTSAEAQKIEIIDGKTLRMSWVLGTDFATISACGSPSGCATMFYETASVTDQSAQHPLEADIKLKSFHLAIDPTVELSIAGIATFKHADSSMNRYLSQWIPANQSDSFSDATAVTILSNVFTSEWTIDFDEDTSIGEEGLISYVYTYVGKYGEEGPPSEPKEIEKKPGYYVDLDVTAHVNDASTIEVEKIRIYRTVAGSIGGVFRFVAEIDNTTQTFQDTVAQQDLGEELAVTELPPDDMTCLKVMPGGIFAGAKEKQLWFSDPYKPYSFPALYNLSVDYFISCMEVGGNSLYVLTEGHPYAVNGSSPDILAIEKLMTHQSCVSMKSVGRINNMVFYASPDGLFAFETGNNINLTENLFTRREWQDLNPETIECEAADDGIFIVSDNSRHILNIRDRQAASLVTTDIPLGTMFTDLLNDTLYFKDGTDLKAWDNGTGLIEGEWHSKQYEINRDLHYSCARVVADNYPITFRLYEENGTYIEFDVPSEEPFRLPSITSQDSFSFELLYSHKIVKCSIATSVGEL